MPGTLYIVTTPIGNLGDLTPRAAQTLAQVDFIAAEDTRVTLKLLNHLGLKKHMVSYYEHNAAARGEEILDRIAAGESAALCTDAGVPAVSDPGEALVADAHRRGLPVVPVPGASAAVTALCVSGLASGRFTFEGFLPMNRRQRLQRLADLKPEPRTMLFYEAPHKLLRTLTDLTEAFGPDRPLTLCRELTKLHEEIRPTTTGAALEFYTREKPRGEFVLVLAGAPDTARDADMTLEEATALARQLTEAGTPPGEAAKTAARRSGQSRNSIYRQLLAAQQPQASEDTALTHPQGDASP